jgi:membrane protease YdiL (CAAX protease family)
MTRPARRALGWLALLVAGWGAAILLAAPVHDLLVSLGWDRPHGFAKVVRRLLLVPPVVVFLIALKPWRAGSLESYGLLGPGARPRSALLSGATTLGVVFLILAGQFAAGWLALEDPLRWGEAGARAVKYLLVGIVVGVLEEWFFRGWLFRVLSRSLRAFPAVLLASLAYALLHVFRPSSLEVEVSHDAAGAWEAVVTWLSRAFDPASFLPSAVGLFLFGLLLSAAYLRTRTLWTSVGIHAAGVWVLHTYGALTVREPERTWAGSKWLYDGWPGWVVLALAALFLWPRARAYAVSDRPAEGP